MAVDNTASTVWRGDLQSGSGHTRLETSSTGEFDVNWTARSEGDTRFTTPEELLAAAHSSCFSMQFSSVLAKNGTPPEQLDVSAKITFVPGTGVTRSVINVTGTVPNIDPERFRELAEDAKENCPVSKALAGVEIVLDSAVLDQ